MNTIKSAMPHPRTRIFDFLSEMAKRDTAVPTSKIASVMVAEGYLKSTVESAVQQMQKYKEVDVFSGAGCFGNPYLVGLSQTAVRFETDKPYTVRHRRSKEQIAKDAYIASKEKIASVAVANATVTKVPAGLNNSIATEFARLSRHENQPKPVVVLTPESVVMAPIVIPVKEETKPVLALVPASMVPNYPTASGLVLTWRGQPLSLIEARTMYEELSTLFGK